MKKESVPFDLNREGASEERKPLQPLKQILLWFDPVARTGTEAMAVDEALLELSRLSVMRVYDWGEPAVTYGYFDRQAVAAATYPGDEIRYVRRWTGGGIVDHRNDVTFTLVLLQPKGEVRPPSSLLYRWIHGALARTLRDNSVDCIMLTEDAPNGGRSCFSSPVTSDLVTSSGEKLAGGGQRRTKRGVLHQGSIQNCILPDEWADNLAHRLADQVIVSRAEEPFHGLNARVRELLEKRYEHPGWSH